MMVAGIGFLVGQKRAEGEARVAAQVADLKAKRSHLAETTEIALFARAFAHASTSIVADIVDELRSSKPRMLSDPANIEMRNEQYVVRADAYIRQATNGRKRLPEGAKARILTEKKVL